MSKKVVVLCVILAQLFVFAYWDYGNNFKVITSQLSLPRLMRFIGNGGNVSEVSYYQKLNYESGLTNNSSEELFPSKTQDTQTALKRLSTPITSTKLLSTPFPDGLDDPTEVGRRYLPVYIERPEATCKVPQLDPWDREIRSQIYHHRKINCEIIQPYFTYINDMNELVLNKSEFVRLKILKPSDYKCWYQLLQRGSGNNDNLIEALPIKYIEVGQSHKMVTDAVKVTCVYFNKTRQYENIHALVSKRSAKKPTRDSELSVFLLVVDSTSLSMFRRSLPLTFEFMTRVMGFNLMRSYNRAGLNSLPNMGIVLTGKRNRNETEDMRDELYNGTSYNSATYDNWPLIWKNFSAKGYVTSYQEEMPQWGLFHYLTGGFLQKPTNHSYRPWGISIYNSKLKEQSSRYCFGNYPQPYLFIDLFERLLTNYKGFKSFIMAFISDLSHDYQQDLEMSDDYLLAFFQRAFESELFNQTAIIVMGDHGAFWGPIRNTVVGRIEENLPFYSIWFPNWFYAKYPHILKNLKMNEAILSSHFDTYETLMDILNENFNGSQRPWQARGLSQLYPIPANRTCKRAGSK